MRAVPPDGADDWNVCLVCGGGAPMCRQLISARRAPSLPEDNRYWIFLCSLGVVSKPFLLFNFFHRNIKIRDFTFQT